MRLYLVQHGEATDKKTDPERPLTLKGSQDIERLGRFATAMKLHPYTIWHSGKRRAQQTAVILGQFLNIGDGIVTCPDMEPDAPPGACSKKILRESRDILFVGHFPHLAHLASCLLLGDQKDTPLVQFHKGGMVALERDENGIWSLLWAVSPEMLRILLD